jgi:hypothetical protein
LLHNPIYKETFGISWQFALRNNTTLRDVRKSLFVSGNDDDVIKAHYTARLKYRLGELETEKQSKSGAARFKKRVVSSALKGLDLSKDDKRLSLAREQSTFGRAKLIVDELEEEEQQENDDDVKADEREAFDASEDATLLDDVDLAAYDAMVRGSSSGVEQSVRPVGGRSPAIDNEEVEIIV